MWNRPQNARSFVLENKLLRTEEVSKASSELLEFLAAVEQGTIEDDGLPVVVHSKSATLESLLSSAGNTFRIQRIAPIELLYAKLTSSEIKLLLNNQDISLVEVDFPGSLELDISVPLIGASDFSHRIGTSGRDVIVAVLDDQVDKDHPAFSGRVIWKENFSGKAWGDISNPSRPEHATMVAGIIGSSGQGSNGNTLIGVAPECTIWNYRVVPLRKVNAQYTNAGVIEAIISAADQGAHILNLSWGKPILDLSGTSDLCKAVAYARSRGCIVVKSAGNNDGLDSSPRPNLTTPGDSPDCVTVGALDNRGTIALKRSSAGPTKTGLQKPDLTAPGGSIDGPTPGGDYEATDSPIFNSTSFAAPHVAGAFALLRAASPNKASDELVEALLQACRVVPEATEDPAKYGRGILDMRLIGL